MYAAANFPLASWPLPPVGFEPMYWGLGASAQAIQAVSAGTSIGGAIASATLAPSVAAILGITAAAAVPVIGAAVVALGFAIEAIINSGCGQSCIITSQWADQAGAALYQNIKTYFAIPAPRPKSVQKIAVANYDAIWQSLVDQCGNPSLGAAGRNCINDRAAGSCKWKALPPEFPGEPVTGSCWNWANALRDPIANDPDVYDDSATSAIASLGGSLSPSTLLLLAALAVGLVVIL